MAWYIQPYQFVVRFLFVFLFFISLQQVSFYFIVNDRFSYLKVCSVHCKICMLQIFIMFSFFISLKFICWKVRENLNLSQRNQGIFAPDMAGNPEKLLLSLESCLSDSFEAHGQALFFTKSFSDFKTLPS